MKLEAYLKQNKITQTELAEMLGGFQTDVSSWILGKRQVPIRHAIQIEILTKGKVTRKDLRDDWAEIWPELR